MIHDLLSRSFWNQKLNDQNFELEIKQSTQWDSFAVLINLINQKIEKFNLFFLDLESISSKNNELLFKQWNT